VALALVAVSVLITLSLLDPRSALVRGTPKVYERGGYGGQQHRVTGQGKAFNRGIRAAKPIRGRGGYFVYDSAVKRYKGIEGLGRRAIDKFMMDATRDIARAKARM
jgi:hypothetical protein